METGPFGSTIYQLNMEIFPYLQYYMLQHNCIRISLNYQRVDFEDSWRLEDGQEAFSHHHNHGSWRDAQEGRFMILTTLHFSSSLELRPWGMSV